MFLLICYGSLVLPLRFKNHSKWLILLWIILIVGTETLLVFYFQLVLPGLSCNSFVQILWLVKMLFRGKGTLSVTTFQKKKGMSAICLTNEGYIKILLIVAMIFLMTLVILEFWNAYGACLFLRSLRFFFGNVCSMLSPL